MTIRVVLIDHQRMLREALRALLANERDLQVVAEAGSGEEAISLARRLAPEVLVLDNALPDMTGFEVAHRLHAAGSPVPLVVLCDHGDERTARKLLRSGLAGYVTKTGAARELICAVRSVARGVRYLTSDVAPLPTDGGFVASDHPPSPGCLAAREREVLRLIAEGAHSPAIALQLGIAVATVDVHRRNVMRKLNLHTVATLTRYAIREGLTTP